MAATNILSWHLASHNMPDTDVWHGTILHATPMATVSCQCNSLSQTPLCLSVPDHLFLSLFICDREPLPLSLPVQVNLCCLYVRREHNEMAQ